MDDNSENTWLRTTPCLADRAHMINNLILILFVTSSWKKEGLHQFQRNKHEIKQAETDTSYLSNCKEFNIPLMGLHF